MYKIFFYKLIIYFIKLFSCVFFSNRQKIQEFFLKLTNVEVKKQRAIKSYLKKYRYKNCEIEKKNTIVEKRSPIVWQLWLQGVEKAPDVVKMCMKSVDKYCSEFEIIRLDENNIHNFIELPDFIINKKRKGIISNTHYSDIVRVYLLEKYGGIWIDATVLLTGKIPDKLYLSDFFSFTVPDNHKMREFHLASSWFIISKPNNPIICGLKYSLSNYWISENKLIDYFTLHIMLLNNIEEDLLLKNEWDKCVGMYNDIPHLLQRSLKNGYDKDDIGFILQKGSIHKLTYNLIGFNRFYKDIEI